MNDECRMKNDECRMMNDEEKNKKQEAKRVHQSGVMQGEVNEAFGHGHLPAWLI
jgi:hypothetical protein